MEAGDKNLRIRRTNMNRSLDLENLRQGSTSSDTGGIIELVDREVIHRNHPPSKIIQDPMKRVSPDELSVTFIDKRSRVEQAYRLYSNDALTLKNKQQFVKYYAAGPLNRIKSMDLTNKKELIRVAIFIQKYIRGFLVRRKYRKYGPAYSKLLSDKLKRNVVKKLDSYRSSPMKQRPKTALEVRSSMNKQTKGYSINEKARMSSMQSNKRGQLDRSEND